MCVTIEKREHPRLPSYSSTSRGGPTRIATLEPVENDFSRPLESKASTRKIMKKAVRFSATCSARLYSPIGGDSAHSTWYSEDDYENFRSECQSVVNFFQAISLTTGRDIKEDPSEQFSYRGLEHIICPTQRGLRRQTRELAFEAVWDEQCYQYHAQNVCETSLADAYQAYSSGCQAQAHARAIRYCTEEGRYECGSRLPFVTPEGNAAANSGTNNQKLQRTIRLQQQRQIIAPRTR